MGRRSINTTKSGKYMNPTDQARKEARKRELKKNKKQRQLVRTAVLKGKDPVQILADLQKIDEMQYNTETPPPLNEKVLKDKRKKLQDTWSRVLRLYHKEDHEKWKELKRLETEYTQNRDQLIKFYESVKSAQNVQLDDIPLPTAPLGPGSACQIPLPPDSNFGLPPIAPHLAPASILKKIPILSFTQKDDTIKVPPGVPPGPPPDLSDDEDIENQVSGNRRDEKEDAKNKKRKIRFADEESKQAPSALQSKLQKTGQDITEFFKEIDAVQQSQTSESEREDHRSYEDKDDMRDQQPPPPLMFHPPLPRSGMLPLRPMPPGLPPPRMAMLGPPLMRPSGPPPGIAPRMLRPPLPPPGMAPNNVVSAPPSLSKSKLEEKRSATIEAKPQLRSLNAEVTRFMPTTLRIKREESRRKPLKSEIPHEQLAPATTTSQAAAQPSKDDAYEQFLKEMKGLI